MREGTVIAPPMLLRCADALEAAGHGDSSVGGSGRRSGAPGASITKYKNGLEWARIT